MPVVSTYHGSDINVPSVRRFSKIAMRMSAWNIFVSKRNMALAGALEGKKASLVPCGVALSDDQLQTRIEARKALGWKTDEKKVLFAGAFNNDVKQPELAKAAVALLNDANDENDGNDVELVELKGYNRQQVNTLMCAVDCLLMTSKTEGSPQVIKEAMACGCPIVSVDVGDVKERITGIDGCYVAETRDPDKLAILLNKALSYRKKTNGREILVEQGLSNNEVAIKIVKIYKNVCGNGESKK
jgi:glycosyltransferase involved in cell wall biosynthesis